MWVGVWVCGRWQVLQRCRVRVQVAKALTYFQYEDVVPAAVLRKRTPAVGDDSPTMYLIRWRDDVPDSWVPEEFVSDEVRTVPRALAPRPVPHHLPQAPSTSGLSLLVAPLARVRAPVCMHVVLTQTGCVRTCALREPQSRRCPPGIGKRTRVPGRLAACAARAARAEPVACPGVRRGHPAAGEGGL